MLLDARAVPHASTLESDICIVGAGAAGIAIATELHERNVRVMLLESGDVTAHEATQALYDGTIAGRAYYPLRNCRSRQLGGTTATWGGWCRPLDSVDFTERAWMPHSGWPFPKQHLEPAYERAQRLCGLGPYDYDIAHWTALDAPPLVPDSPHFRETVLQIHATRFGEVYRARLESSGTVKVLLHANGLSLEMDPLNRTAERVRVATLNGNQFAVAAKRFVLATGGLENPRLLLASHGASDAGVGNEHDLVGRFFFDHLHVPVAHLRDQDGRFPSFYATHDVRGATVRGALGLTHDAMVGEQRYGFGVTFHNAKDPHDIFSLAQVSEGYDSLRYLAQSLARGDRPARALHHAASAVAGAGEIATIAWRKFVKPSARQ